MNREESTLIEIADDKTYIFVTLGLFSTSILMSLFIEDLTFVISLE